MIRKPLRPLARILLARAKGENPDLIERENIRLRAEDSRARAQSRAEGRLLILGLAFFAAFTVVGIRMGALSASVPEEPRSASNGAEISGRRADITDRNGRILATNFSTFSLYAQPRQMVDPKHVAT
jgi:cell division protein FtsI (penicillin-binding protein 3)